MLIAVRDFIRYSSDPRFHHDLEVARNWEILNWRFYIDRWDEWSKLDIMLLL